MTLRPLTMSALLALAAVGLAACAGPQGQRAQAGSGAVTSAREMDVMGEVTIARTAASEALEGDAALRTMCNCKAEEYVVRLDSGATLTIAQELGSNEPALRVGDRVVIETRGDGRHVVLAPTA